MPMSLEQQKKNIARFIDSITDLGQLEDRMADLRALWNAADLVHEITDEAYEAMGVTKLDITNSNNAFDAVIATAVTYKDLISCCRKDLDYPAIR